MNDTPRLTSIDGQLAIALRQFLALPGIKEQFAGSLISTQLGRISRDMAEKEQEWLTAVPAIQELHDWIVTHWDAVRKTQPPADTVSTGDNRGNEGETQIDPMTAACKLLLAAAVHGAETVGKYAMEFSAHGMIEVRLFYLLKGLSVSNAKPLDDYCTLIPYREALEKARAVATAQYVEDYLDWWPPDSSEDICALEVRSFERRGLAANEFERRVSRLLQCGQETFALILGLVWGSGLRVFGFWHDVAGPVAATLPFFRATSGCGTTIEAILLALPGFKPPSLSRRPLNKVEFMELTSRYADLPKQERRVLDLAMRRLRDSTERVGLDDKVVDLSIAVEALFSGGCKGIRKAVSCRGSWYFSDSPLERTQVSKLLKKFYDDRSYIVHGSISKCSARKRKREQNRGALFAKTDNVVRASLKTMISEGIPQKWEDSKDPTSIRHDPPREETEIPSVKSDSLSWTVAEQNEIDQALEAVWRPTIDNAPEPAPNASSVSHQGVDRAKIKQLEQQSVYYIIAIPALLYMAHPKWLERANEPLDDHTRYYCERDVARHLQKWQEAAGAKKVYQFDLPLEDATSYLPNKFDFWRKLVSRESAANPL